MTKLRDSTKNAILSAHVLGKGSSKLFELYKSDKGVTHVHLAIAKRALHDAQYASRSDYQQVANFGFDARDLREPEMWRNFNADRMKLSNRQSCATLVAALQSEIDRQGILPTLAADLRGLALLEPAQRWMEHARRRWLGAKE